MCFSELSRKIGFGELEINESKNHYSSETARAKSKQQTCPKTDAKIMELSSTIDPNINENTSQKTSKNQCRKSPEKQQKTW